MKVCNDPAIIAEAVAGCVGVLTPAIVGGRTRSARSHVPDHGSAEDQVA